jgi:hypothetical protein
LATDPDPMNAPADPPEPPGLRDQIQAVVAAARRLLTAHIELAKAEASEIMGEVGRVALLGGLAFGMVFLVGILVPIGLLLLLGEWLFGSIGWGVLLGSLLLLDVAVVAVLVAVGAGTGRLGRAFLAALLLGVVVGIALGLNLTNRGWTLAGDAVFPTLDAGVRPLLIAVVSLAIVGGVAGLIGALRAGGGGGSVFAGIVAGAIVGAVLGVLTAIALGPRVGAAFGVLAWLTAWPAVAAAGVAGTGIDTDALKARFYPGQTIETTKETIEWVRQRTPLGPRS